MKKIVITWMVISLAAGLVPAFFLGISRGGIELSPYIIAFSIIVGLFCASIHAVIYAFKRGNKEQKYSSIYFGVFALLIVYWLWYSATTCDLAEEYAHARILNYIESREDLVIEYLGELIFSEKECTYTLDYQSPEEKFQILISANGKLHFIFD